ncbi:DUF3261 domain-containing protein [Flocculibacter collagenilyticus]|uniref:DUF3261 domain-containing protein n=1 Tax=Flocculibacter collagenilyticus TaxID=2744479 RepID=UPI0018F2C1B3|nr:DUF3261 domain-containing protein [Flocculibacter collagenilyticus]
MPYRIAIVFCLILITGCASKIPTNTQSVSVASDVNLSLSMPQMSQLTSLKESQQQLITFKSNNHNRSILVNTEYDLSGIKMVAMSPQGIPLFSLNFIKEQQIQLQRYIPLDDLRPEYIMADFQLVHWPVELLNKHLNGGKIEEKHNGNERVIIQDSKTVIRIKYNKHHINFEHLERGYTFTITPIK